MFFAFVFLVSSVLSSVTNLMFSVPRSQWFRLLFLLDLLNLLNLHPLYLLDLFPGYGYQSRGSITENIVLSI